MVATEEVWLPREVHNNYRGTTCRNDGEYGRWRLHSPDRALTYSTSHTSERRPRLLGY